MAESKPPLVVADSERRERRFAALYNPRFRLYWLSMLASFSGEQMRLIAQGWLVLELTNSPFYLGLTGAAAGLPALFFSVFGGVMADRVERRKLLITCQVGVTLLTLALALLIGTALVQVWHVIAVAVATGLINAFNGPANQAYVTELVKEDDLLNAISLNAAAMNITRIGGPAIGGAIIAVLGTAPCFLVNGVAHLVATFALFCIPRTKATGRVSKASVWANAVEGLSFVKGNKAILWLLAVAGIPSLFGTMGIALIPVFARDILNVGASGLGVLMGVTGIGALGGSLAIAAVGSFRRKGIVLCSSGILHNVGTITFALSTWFPLSLAGMAIQGMAGSGWSASITTLLQTQTPNELRGRVMSLYLISMQTVPLAQILSGALAGLIGAPYTAALGALVAFSFNLSALVVTPVVRRLD